jgi:diaminopimelate epimerase
MIPFVKYQGTGNDFILIDNRSAGLRPSKEAIARICDRHFGVGADGLMLLEHSTEADFRMVYFNSDGGESTMCGNGGRCITAFAAKLGLAKDGIVTFVAVDGIHRAQHLEDGRVSLQMGSVKGIERGDGYSVLDTGSPHFVQWVEDVMQRDVHREGRAIRHWEEFEPKGINVNFAQLIGDRGLSVRTYERGVEGETLSCGTGVTAAAIAATAESVGSFSVPVDTPGGRLVVSFTKTGPDEAENVMLTGPAAFVFEGMYSTGKFQ